MANNRKQRRLRRTEGICPECGGPVAEGRAKCAYCLRVHAARSRQAWNIRKFQHRCPRCGGEPVPGLIHCAKCLAMYKARRAA